MTLNDPQIKKGANATLLANKVLEKAASQPGSEDYELAKGRDIFTAAKAEWNSVLGREVEHRRNWQKAFFAVAGIATAAVGGVIYFGSQNHMVPYAILLDKIGDAVLAGPIHETTVQNEKAIRSDVAAWVKAARSVYGDRNAESDQIKYVYARLPKTAPAATFMNEFYTKNQPFQRAASELVTVDINSALPISDMTWRIEWTEKTFPRNGNPGGERRWSATVTIALVPPDNLEAAMINPLGVFVQSLSWAERI